MIRFVKWLPLILGAGLVFAVPAHAADAKARTYDCSKAGNKNKAACKTATTAPAPAAKPSTPASAVPASGTATARNYDCSKAGNKNKAVCKGAATAPAAKPAPAAAKPAPAAAAAVPTVAAAGPNGATAKCKDGTYSNAKNHSGACSHHGGVAQWFK